MSICLKKAYLDTQRMTKFKKIKAEYMDFLTFLLWQLTGEQERFVQAMQYALFRIWQDLERIKGKKAQDRLYKIILEANAHVWQDKACKNNVFKHKSALVIQRQLLAQYVRMALSRLHSKQAMAIILHYFERKDHKTIAKKLGCSPFSVGDRIADAITALKHRLQSWSDNPMWLLHTKPVPMPLLVQE